MTARDMAIAAFVARCGWAAASLAPLAGDASNRRYLRLTRSDGTATVLMDAPPDRDEDIRPFQKIALHLQRCGLHPPAIVAADPEQGLMLLEDLGDALFARVLDADPSREPQLYTAATDVLIHLHGCPLPKDIPVYDAALMSDLATLPLIWYAPDPGSQKRLRGAMKDALRTHAPETSTLALRDYHAENLIWRPHDGLNAVGLLDFQDAMAAHPLYDLVSLLTDVRRTVGADTAQAMRARYRTARNWEADRFDAAFAVLSAQRNLRILGVFARLCLRDGKPRYLDLLPDVWAQLQTALAHPALAAVRATLSDLPPPTPTIRSELERQCGSRPSR